MNYTSYPRLVVEDIARLRLRIEASGLPGKLLLPPYCFDLSFVNYGDGSPSL